MIARIWRGAVRAGDAAAAYAEYVQRTGIEGYDERFLIDRDLTVNHYEIAATE